MSIAAGQEAKVIPAQLSFLTIYNPSLGRTDETFRDQVVFYYSKAARTHRKSKQHDANAERERREEENEKLRQIGLAQGMVDFARSFSNGEAVDTVDTEKSRIVIHELENGWWILASIDLTRLPAVPATPSTTSDSKSSPPKQPAVEYSSREVSPAMLLLQQLIRAHRIFSLHHGPSLQDLYARLERTRFCNTLERFWTRFANTWDILLHGSPAVDIYAGIKLAAGGELGIGVGEEEWGSGEREVLEDFAGRTEGLVDMVVSRYGEPSSEQTVPPNHGVTKTMDPLTEPPEPWMGAGWYPNAADGVFFSNCGQLSRSSIRDISDWTQWIYAFGEFTYGIRDNPNSDRRKRRKKRRVEAMNGRPSSQRGKTATRHNPSRRGSRQSNTARALSPIHNTQPGIPPPMISAVEKSLENASAAVDGTPAPEHNDSVSAKSSLADPEVWMKYLTLGYGSSWGYSSKRPQSSRQTSHISQIDKRSGNMDDRNVNEEPALQYLDPEPDVDEAEETLKAHIRKENTGHFIIGFQGDLDADDGEGGGEDNVEIGPEDGGSRTLLRTVHVQVMGNRRSEDSCGEDDGDNREQPPDSETSRYTHKRLRVIVYVHRPFIYTFLFDPRTESLSLPSFYRNLHTYLQPLHKPLTASTSPARVTARIAAAANPYTTAPSDPNSQASTIQPIYDLLFDPASLTIHSSIPNIPAPGTLSAEGLGLPATSGAPVSSVRAWTRVEALNVHSQILATAASTRRSAYELERTCKTTRGWWVVWMRLPPSSSSNLPRSTDPDADELEGKVEDPRPEDLREAFLVRRARDAWPASVKSGKFSGTSGMFGFGFGGTGGWVGGSSQDATGGAAAGWGPARLAEGIGIDARKYVEGLLSLNR